MAFENVDQDPEEGDPPPTGTSPNRTFLYVAGGLGGLVLLTLICMAVYALVIKPRQDNTSKLSQQATETAASLAQAQQNQVATEVEKTARALVEKITATSTPKAVLPTATMSNVTPTQVVAVPTDAAGTATLNPLTATSVAKTAAALQLTLTAAHQTGTPGTPVVTSLPTTGFFEDSGSVPMLIGAAFLLILVIFLARRLRTAS
jgi:hypothetical protein